MSILRSPSYLRAFKKFPEADQSKINGAIARLPDIIGHPHRHSGAGVRRLRPSVFEIRAGLHTRILFTVSSGDIVVHTVGNHNDIRNFLKENF